MSGNSISGTGLLMRMIWRKRQLCERGKTDG